MSSKSKHKSVGLCVMVGAICIALAGLLTVLSTPNTALAAKPGGIPVCISFGPDGGVQSDDGTPYCDDKQLKVGAKMTQDGHLDLWPNKGKEDGRTLYVYVDLDGSTVLTEGWRFLVGAWNEGFDMRAMAEGQSRDDVNMWINTYTSDGITWRLYFDPSYRHGDKWSAAGSTYVTVTCTGADETTGAYEWVVENKHGNEEPSLALLVEHTIVNHKNVYKVLGLVTVPQFKATVTLK